MTGELMKSAAERWRGCSPASVLAATLWGEARGVDALGRAAVALVIMNRAERGGWFGSTIVEICLKPWQFSCWNSGDPNEAKLASLDEDDPTFRECLVVAELSLANIIVDITRGSTHYHTASMGWPESWGEPRAPAARIGGHLFYNNVD